MLKIGYARVSSLDQNLARQIAALRAEGCDKIYSEKASGKDMKYDPKLSNAIGALLTKGILVLAEWDRATRSLMDGIALMDKVHKRGAYLKVLDYAIGPRHSGPALRPGRRAQPHPAMGQRGPHRRHQARP
jgi:DNA invertase Pin-like site-specific DNA recombinase